MEGFKGTPAPWVRCKSGSKLIASGSIFDGSEGYLIGSLCGNDNSGFYASEEEAEANAQLVVTAPELLEALQELTFLYEHDEGCRNLTEYKRAKAAIAKALGK